MKDQESLRDRYKRTVLGVMKNRKRAKLVKKHRKFLKERAEGISGTPTRRSTDINMGANWRWRP